MKMLFDYLHQRRGCIALFLIFALIFVLSFALYHLPVLAVLYPASLCMFLGIAAMVFDYMNFQKRHRLLSRIRTFSDIEANPLPKPSSRDQADYQAIIQSLQDEHRRFYADTQKKHADSMDYFTVWAHQIKTPIAAMRLNLQNEDSPLTRKLSNTLMRIEQYVAMVLTFLRLNSQTTDYVFKTCDLDKIVRSAVKKFSTEFIDRKLSLVYQPLKCTVVTDEKWLSFVIEQVLSNALKYTPSGSITIALKGENTLAISDTGIGIAPEDLPRIFENGFTGCNGRADRTSSGIGLYLCKRICDNLGHAIAANARVGQGTTIEIDLSQTTLEIE